MAPWQVPYNIKTNSEIIEITFNCQWRREKPSSSYLSFIGPCAMLLAFTVVDTPNVHSHHLCCITQMRTWKKFRCTRGTGIKADGERASLHASSCCALELEKNLVICLPGRQSPLILNLILGTYVKNPLVSTDWATSEPKAKAGPSGVCEIILMRNGIC